MIEKIELPYPVDALEPYYNKETLVLHYDVLYSGYVNNTNKTEEKLKVAREKNDFDMRYQRFNYHKKKVIYIFDSSC